MFAPARRHIRLLAAVAPIVAALSTDPAFPEPGPARVSSAPQELVVFVQPGVSEVSRSFEREQLPAIKRLAQSLGLPVTVVDVRHGAPPDVTTTPLLVYQSHKGRSVYQGRYTSLERIETFLRAAGLSALGLEPFQRRDLLVWTRGRARVAAPIKVARVTGHVPAHYDHAAFVSEAKEAILSGLRRFHHRDEVTLARSDRSFYMDFNPWLSEDGRLFLSVELFSQHHCKKPVFTHEGKPFVGPWARRDRLFSDAAAALEDAVVRHASNADIGDGFDPVSGSVPPVSFEQLGLVLPQAPPHSRTMGTRLPPAHKWTARAEVGESGPALVFHFASPLSGYSGEVRSFRGALDLATPLSLEGASASFEADVSSVTMGEPDLDKALRGSALLASERYPKAGFVTHAVTTDQPKLDHGSPVTAQLDGTFTMKGVSIPLELRASFEPVRLEAGASGLNMEGTFSLPLEPFGIEGPDGPEPARNTLVFQFDFVFVPAPVP